MLAPFPSRRKRHARIASTLVLCLLSSSALASITGVSDADRAADVDWPMYNDPELGEIERQRKFDPRLIDLWRAALDRPDVDTPRRAMRDIRVAHERGMQDLAQFTPKLIELVDAPGQHPALALEAARTLVMLDARAAAPSLVAHNKRGGASGVIRGDAVEQLDSNQPANGGIEMVLATDAALARWVRELNDGRNHASEDNQKNDETNTADRERVDAALQSATDIWQKRLAAPRAARAVRLSAARSLADANHTAAAAPLLDLALDRDSRHIALRLEAARAFSRLAAAPPTDDAAALADGNLVDRLVAATLLTAGEPTRNDDTAALLLQLAADAEPTVAAIAGQRVIDINPTLLIPAAAKLLTSRDPKVRLIAARALAAAPSPQTVAALAPHLADHSPTVREFVRRRFIAFGQSDDESLAAAVRQHAERALDASQWRALEQAAIIVGRLDHESVADRLVALLAFPRDEVKLAVIVALRRLAVRDTLPAALAHAEREAARWLRELEAMQADPAQPTAIDAAFDKQLSQLFQLFGELDYREADPLARKFIAKDSGYWMEARGGAIWALGKFHAGEPDAALVARFAERLADDNPANPEMVAVRRAAAVALGRMKTTNDAALKTLRTFLDREAGSIHVGGASRWALMQITGDDLPPLPTRVITESNWFLEPLQGGTRRE